MIWSFIAISLLIANCFAKIDDLEKLSANLDGSCEPNTYIFIDCNVCHCDSNGRIDTDHCTRRPCNSDKNKPYKTNSNEYEPYKVNNDKYQPYKVNSDKYQSFKGSSNEYRPYKARRMAVHGSCESGTWYSLAPCQFCYCVDNNKLVCSTGNSQKSQLLELGMYNLTVCGKHLIKDVLELIPEGQDALRQGSQIVQNQINQQTNADKSYGAPAYLEPKHDAPNINYGAMAPVTVPQSQFKFNREGSEENNKTSNDVSEYDSDIESLETIFKQATSKSDKVVSSTQPYDEDEDTSGETEEGEAKKKHKHKNKSKHHHHHHSTPEITNEELTRPEKDYNKYDIKDQKTNKPNEVDQTSRSDSDSSLLGASGMLRLKLPQVLDKLLQMSLRKSFNKYNDDSIEDLRSGGKKIYY